MIYLIGLIFLSIEIFMLKNISYNISESILYKEYKKYKLKVWHLIVLILLNLYWTISIIVFIVITLFFIAMLLESDVKINYNKDSELFKFLNKEI